MSAIEDFKQFKCANCDCPLQGFGDPNADARLACPNCGQGDTLQNVMAEVNEYIQEQATQYLIDGARDAFRGPHFKVTSDFKPKGQHRFVLDLDLE